jgi:hypothetical protein
LAYDLTASGNLCVMVCPWLQFTTPAIFFTLWNVFFLWEIVPWFDLNTQLFEAFLMMSLAVLLDSE